MPVTTTKDDQITCLLLILLMVWKKSGVNSVEVGSLFPIIYRVSAPSQVVDSRMSSNHQQCHVFYAQEISPKKGLHTDPTLFS